MKIDGKSPVDFATFAPLHVYSNLQGIREMGVQQDFIRRTLAVLALQPATTYNPVAWVEPGTKGLLWL